MESQRVLLYSGKSVDLFNPALLDSWARMAKVNPYVTLGMLKASTKPYAVVVTAGMRN